MVSKDPLLSPFTIKEELEFDYDDVDQSIAVFGAGNGGAGSANFLILGSRSPGSELSEPMGGLHVLGAPPFLRKTFEMVEDPETDPIASWSDGSDYNFVVWDPHGFAVKLLPKYFKHRNFSSFGRQLNTYGFRKDGSLQMLAFVEARKKHLLKSEDHQEAKPRSQQQEISGAPETEIERLKEERKMLRLEILGLKTTCF